MSKDHYETLGVGKNASKEEIKKAYKTLAKKYHPDLNNDPLSAERFKEINEAASVLGDDKKREQYDQMGHSAFQNAARGQGPRPEDFDYSQFRGDFDFEDIFDMFFSGSSGRGRTKRGDDLRYDMTMTLEEAAFGTKKTVNIRKYERCEDCSGKGGKHQETCNACHGQGMVRQARRTPFGVFQSTAPCRQCEGTGHIIKNICPACDGEGIVYKSKQIEVSIPAGVDEGTRVRVSGEGNAGSRGSANGDLYIFISVEPHNLFERKGHDIHLDVPITFPQAVFGAEIEIPTLDGKAKLKIPHSTQTHTVFRLKDKGVKEIHGHGHGDQYVRVMIKTPEKLTKRQEQLLKEFSGDRKDDEKLQKGLFAKIKDRFS